MPRTNRKYKPNYYYHIYNRGNNKELVLRNAEDKRLFISLLYKNIRRTDLLLDCYCIMDNHFHLIIKIGNNPQMLSKCMQRLTVSFAMQINRKYKRVGHVFQGRYEAKILWYKKDLKQAREYIKRNPVAEGLVRRARDYPWERIWGQTWDRPK